MEHPGARTGWSERNRDYRLRTEQSYVELVVRQLGAHGNGFDTRRIEIFKVTDERPNPEQAARIMLNPHQAAALCDALLDFLQWEHNY